MTQLENSLTQIIAHSSGGSWTGPGPNGTVWVATGDTKVATAMAEIRSESAKVCLWCIVICYGLERRILSLLRI